MLITVNSVHCEKNDVRSNRVDVYVDRHGSYPVFWILYFEFVVAFVRLKKTLWQSSFFFGRVKIYIGTIIFRSSQYQKYWQVFRPIYPKQIYKFFQTFSELLKLEEIILIHAKSGRKISVVAGKTDLRRSFGNTSR
jgi:hypothetical protein